MTPNVFKWTDFALAHGIRIVTILVIALILNRVLAFADAPFDSQGREPRAWAGSRGCASST